MKRSSALRMHRVSMPDGIYHVTKCIVRSLGDRLDLTANGCGEFVVQAILHQRNHSGCRLFAFALMPDHVHWLFALPEGKALGERVGVFANWSAAQINRLLARSGRIWQDGYYEHLVKEWEKVSELIRYIEANPVRRGLCETPEQWRWSSAHAEWRESLDRVWLHPGRFE